jgi:hypothetical protein
MAEYKGIKGFKVQTVSTDPAASIIATGTWASGGTMNTATYNASGGDGGTSSAAFAAGGVEPGYYSYNARTIIMVQVGLLLLVHETQQEDYWSASGTSNSCCICCNRKNILLR